MAHYRTQPTTGTQVPQSAQTADSDPDGFVVFGCGYLGKCVAESLVFSGQRVWATTRNAGKADQLASAGIEPVIADWCDPATLGQLPQAGSLLISVSYDRGSGVSRRQSQITGLSNLLERLDRRTRVVYISTTGVYHQTDGGWIDEASPAQPKRDGGIVHLEAESLLASKLAQGQYVTLRLSGIYGPDRVPRIADVVSGRPISSREDGFLNLIHVQDAASAVIQAWKAARHELYLVSDDEPVQRGEFYREVANQLDAPPPKFLPPEPGSLKSARSESNKRISNRRMKDELISSLAYPSYREGLVDVLDSYR